MSAMALAPGVGKCRCASARCRSLWRGCLPAPRRIRRYYVSAGLGVELSDACPAVFGAQGVGGAVRAALGFRAFEADRGAVEQDAGYAVVFAVGNVTCKLADSGLRGRCAQQVG